MEASGARCRANGFSATATVWEGCSVAAEWPRSAWPLDVRLGRAVAVKLLSGESASDPVVRTLFEAEARASARLHHPGIVKVLDSGEDLDPDTGVSTPYLVLEYVAGETLRSILSQDQRLPRDRALRVINDILDALAYSHRSGVVHQDIKPSNVMLTPSGGVKLMDFGVARSLADVAGGEPRALPVGGTAKYLSPEQARGEATDARSDVYSVGCVLYEMLVGKPPFVGDSFAHIVDGHLTEPPAPPSDLDPLISADLDAVLLRALTKNPDDRYASADQMRADLAAVLSPPQTSEEPTAEQERRPVGAVPPARPAVPARGRPTVPAGPRPVAAPARAARPGVPAARPGVATRPVARPRRRLALATAGLVALALPLGALALRDATDAGTESAGPDLTQVLRGGQPAPDSTRSLAPRQVPATTETAAGQQLASSGQPKEDGAAAPGSVAPPAGPGAALDTTSPSFVPGVNARPVPGAPQTNPATIQGSGAKPPGLTGSTPGWPGSDTTSTAPGVTEDPATAPHPGTSAGTADPSRGSSSSTGSAGGSSSSSSPTHSSPPSPSPTGDSPSSSSPTGGSSSSSSPTHSSSPTPSPTKDTPSSSPTGDGKDDKDKEKDKGKGKAKDPAPTSSPTPSANPSEGGPSAGQSPSDPPADKRSDHPKKDKNPGQGKGAKKDKNPGQGKGAKKDKDPGHGQGDPKKDKGGQKDKSPGQGKKDGQRDKTKPGGGQDQPEPPGKGRGQG